MDVIPSVMPSDKPLITLVMEPDLIQKVEDFQFTHRFKTRAAAMKWLLNAAIDAGLAPGPDDLRFTPKVRGE